MRTFNDLKIGDKIYYGYLFWKHDNDTDYLSFNFDTFIVTKCMEDPYYMKYEVIIDGYSKNHPDNFKTILYIHKESSLNESFCNNIFLEANTKSINFVKNRLYSITFKTMNTQYRMDFNKLKNENI